MRSLLERFDRELIRLFGRHAHRLHRLSLGVLFVWFGLLKPFGHETATSVLADTIYWGEPRLVVVALGWWEVAIGLCLLARPLLRVAILLLAIRLPGILLAFAIEPEVLFLDFPFAPTVQGQYLLKDFALFFAALAMASYIGEPSHPEKRH